MRRARVSRIRIDELRRRIGVIEGYERKLRSYAGSLQDKLTRKEINSLEYEEALKKKYDGRTVSQWFVYYEKYMQDCEYQIAKERKELLKSRILTGFFSLLLLGLLISLFYLTPRLIGLIVQDNEKEFVQNLNLEFGKSENYEWKLENVGTLLSAKLSGSIEGKGQVKIYLDNLLVLDSDKIDKKNVVLTGGVIEESENGNTENSGQESVNIEQAAESSGGGVESGEQGGAEIISSDSEGNEGGISQKEDSSPSQEEPPISSDEKDNEKDAEEIKDINNAEEVKEKEEDGVIKDTKDSEIVDEGSDSEGNEGDISQKEDSSPSQETPPTSSEAGNVKKDEKFVFEFSDICEETCSLEGLDLNKNSYNLRIEIENAKVRIDNVKYEIIQRESEDGLKEEGNESVVTEEELKNITKIENITEIENITGPPVLIKEIEDIKIEKNSFALISINEYFTNADKFYLLQVMNISSTTYDHTLRLAPDKNFVGERSTKIIVENSFGRTESNLFNVSVIDSVGIGYGLNISTLHYKSIINKPTKWIKIVNADEIDEIKNAKIKLPKEARNISVKTGREIDEALNELEEYDNLIENSDREDLVSGGITGNVAFDIESREGILTKLWKWLKGFTITGNVLQEEELSKEIIETEENKIIDLGNIANQTQESEIAVEYYTEGPAAVEQDIVRGKQVVVSGNDELNYTDILAFASIDERFNVGDESKIKVYWREIGEYINFSVYDLDSNGKLDYVEWIVPHLSNQTFDIILITKAEHLNENREFISDIYDFVKELDGNWSEEIKNNEYVRVTFEQKLTRDRDITLYSRKISGNPKIEVYEINGSEIIAEFKSLRDDEYNKVFLDGSSGAGLGDKSQNSFDLRVVGGSVEIEHIIDPPTEHLFEDCSTGAITDKWVVTASWAFGSGGDAGLCFTGNTAGASVNMTLTAPIDLTGKVSANFSFLMNNLALDAATSDVFRVWVNSSAESWKLLLATVDNTAQTVSFELFNNITMTTGVHVRFECNTNHNAEDCRVDNVNITSFTAPDNEFPIFSSFTEVPANNTAYVSGALYRFNSTVTVTNGTVGIEFNGVNYTASNLTASIFNFSFSNLGAGSYTYYWFAWGNGTDKNYNISALREYSVAKASQSITPLLNGNNANLVVTYPQQINASFSGTNNTAVSININGTSVNVGRNYTWGVGGWVVNYSLTTNQNYTGTDYFLNLTVNRASSEVNLTLNSTEGNITITSGDTILLNGTLITGDNSARLLLYNNGTLINNNTIEASNNTQFNTVGLFNITVFYETSQNYSTSFETYWVNVTAAGSDITAPIVTINFPANTTYGSNNLPFNFNVSLNENGSVMYSLNGGRNNKTMLFSADHVSVFGNVFNHTNNSIADGSYIFSVYANDTTGNKNYTASITFSFDLLPNATLLSPADGFNSTTANVSLSCAVNDTRGLVNSTLYFGSSGGAASISLVQQANKSHVYLSPSTSIGVNLTSPPVANRLLITAITSDKNAGTYTAPGGFTIIQTTSATSISAALAYKISNGTEQNITWSYTTSEESSVWYAEYSGLETSNVLDISAHNTTFSGADTATTLITAQNSTSTSQADELAIAMATIDTGPNCDAGRAWSNGFSEVVYVNDSTSGTGTPGLSISSKTLTSVGAQSTVYSCSDTGDQMYAIIATFKASSGIAWHANQTINVSGTTNTTTFNLNLTNGTYSWNCLATDTSNQMSFAVSNFTLNVSTAAANNVPQIISVTNISNQDPTENATTYITFNFSVLDSDGAGNLNNNSARANFTRAGGAIRSNSSCVQVNAAGNYANYSCRIDMWYFDSAGAWNITTYINDSAVAAINESATFQYNQLQAIVIGPSSLTFGSIVQGATNQTSNNDPTLINNTGNYNVTSGNIQINAIDLYGQTTATERIFAGNFSAGITTGAGNPECAGSSLVNGSYVGITGAFLNYGNHSLNDGSTGQEQLYYCITKAPTDISSQTYSTTNAGSWTIRILVVIFAPRMRRKKRLEQDNLVKAFGLVMIELRESYSSVKAEAADLLLSELRKKYRVGRKDIINITEKRDNLEIPLGVFSGELGGLEAVVKYMKENLHMNYKEISEKLNRNERTIWSAYRKALEKDNSPILIKDINIVIPIKLLADRKLTIFESVIVYLKDMGLRYNDIAGFLERDQRNIWTIYSRAVRKLSWRKI